MTSPSPPLALTGVPGPGPTANPVYLKAVLRASANARGIRLAFAVGHASIAACSRVGRTKYACLSIVLDWKGAEVMNPGTAAQRFDGLLRPLQTPERRPAPIPKRPKGQWFIGLMLVALIGVCGFAIWNAYFRYEAFGTLSARLIQSSAAIDGELKYLLVREGDRVRQGDPLFSIDNIELQQRHAQIGDELRTAQAELQAQVANLKWQSAFGLDQSRGAAAFYFDTWGKMLQAEARRDFCILQRDRALALMKQHFGAPQDYDQYRLEVQGLDDLIAKLKESLASQKPRVEQIGELLKKGDSLAAGMAQEGADQLLPFRRKLEGLEAERRRILARLEQGIVRAPANGLVVKVTRSPGERCKSSDPVLTIMDDGSLRVVLYMPQEFSAALASGDEVKLVLDPYPDPFVCRVEQVGSLFEPAPPQIKRHYTEGQRLLPVFLIPQSGSEQWMALRVGEVVKLPYSFGHLFRKG